MEASTPHGGLTWICTLMQAWHGGHCINRRQKKKKIREPQWRIFNCIVAVNALISVINAAVEETCPLLLLNLSLTEIFSKHSHSHGLHSLHQKVISIVNQSPVTMAIAHSAVTGWLQTLTHHDLESFFTKKYDANVLRQCKERKNWDWNIETIMQTLVNYTEGVIIVSRTVYNCTIQYNLVVSSVSKMYSMAACLWLNRLNSLWQNVLSNRQGFPL